MGTARYNHTAFFIINPAHVLPFMRERHRKNLMLKIIDSKNACSSRLLY
jgi:hypothetical protein